MISLTTRNTFIGTLALVALAASSISASEITGFLDSSRDTPQPSEETSPALTGPVVAETNEPPDSPVSTGISTAEVSSETSSSQMILSSYTDTTNLPRGNSLAEHPLPSNSDSLAILHSDTAPNTKQGASTIMGSIAAMPLWWWAATLFFVLILFAGLYAYRPRHNERRWMDRQY